MAATYKGILTNNGKALIANATVNNKINYSHIAVGDGNGSVPTPLETRTALVNEKARIALNVVEINANDTNQIVCEAIIPSSTGGFFIRELGLYAGNTMIVNASYPPTYKPLADEGGAREIAIKIVINIQNAEVIALYLDDSLIYATREWVNKNYIRRNELVDNLTSNDATKPLTAKQGKKLQDEKFDKSGGTVDGDLRVNGLAYIKRIRGNEDLWITDESEENGRRVLAGGLLVSNSYSQANLIPSLGIYSKGAIHTSGNVYSDEYRGYTKNPVFYGALSGNADTTTKLQTPRNIALSGAVSGNANFDGSGNITISTTANNAIGVGQSWQDVSSNRVVRTTYTNTTGRPIQIFINANFDNGYITLNGSKYFVADAAAWGWVNLIIPNGDTYMIEGSGDQRILTWLELR